MDRESLLNYLGDEWKRTEELIRSALFSDIRLLNETNNFILEHSGKQLRPMMALLVAKACGSGKVTQDSIRFAAATELLHNATLLHDDVADNSDTRRGVPTVFSLLGGAPSVLIGDFWLVKAVNAIVSANCHGSEVISLFSNTLSDLAEGEMLQLQKAAAADTSEEDYMRIIYSKTASLFVAGCMSAAISVDASDAVKEAVRRYAVSIGLAYQVKDDIMDYEGGDIGKPTGVDLKEGKITLPLLGAFKNSDEKVEGEMRRLVREIPENAGNIDTLVSYVKTNGGIEYAREKLEGLCKRAAEALDILTDSAAKQYLLELAGYTGKRDK